MTSRRTRTGYTLLELTLVCAVLAALGALSYPTVDGMYGHYRLIAGIDATRAAWADGRARAVQDSTAYRFSIVPGTGNFRLAPDRPDCWGGAVPDGCLVIEGVLPQNITFGAADGTGAPAAVTASSAQVSPGAYTDLAYFQPDGTARGDVKVAFQLKGAPNKVLQLRSLTSVVTVQPYGGSR